MTEKPAALVETSYWDDVWTRTDLPAPSSPEVLSLRNHGKNELHLFFARHLLSVERPASCVEFGCAQSTWLPYFARVHGLSIAGMDYSALGCERARAILQREGIDGPIIERDLFEAPGAEDPRYDAAVSFGVVEHFKDPAVALAAMSNHLKPGGLLLTIVPNMTGLTGALQRWADPEIFSVHTPLDADALQDAHARAGLEPIETVYVLPIGLGVVNPGATPSTARRLVLKGGFALTGLVWALDRALNRSLPRVGALAPYVACAATVAPSRSTGGD